VVGTGTSRQVLYSTRVPRTGTHLLSLNNLKVKKVKKGLLTFKKSTNLPVCTYHIRYIHEGKDEAIGSRGAIFKVLLAQVAGLTY
jgi:hypothetical protein